ncbi:MAG: hypothetical protein Q4E29_07800 [Lachnospiraceae bacterium]|nr:hypothetical protein [Lachnospiraceae bacterium]
MRSTSKYPAKQDEKCEARICESEKNARKPSGCEADIWFSVRSTSKYPAKQDEKCEARICESEKNARKPSGCEADIWF